MGVFEIQGPDGEKFQIEAPSAAIAERAYRILQTRKTLSPQRREQMGARTDQLNRKAEAAIVEEQNPGLGQVATTLSGVPFIGEGMDEFVGYAAEKIGGMPREEATERMRLAREGYNERRPGASLALGLTGGVIGAGMMAPAIGGAVASAPTSLLGQSIYGAGTGLVSGFTEGAVSGFLAGRGGVDNRIETAKDYAKLGAGAGVVLGALTPVVARGARVGAEHVADYLQNRGIRAAGMDPNTTRVVSSYLGDLDPDDAIANARRAGPEAMLADVGYSARKLTDAGAQLGGSGSAARNAVEGRASRSVGQLNDALDSTLGRPGVSQSTDLVVYGERRSPIRILYERAYRQPIDYSSAQGREIERLVRDHVPPEAIRVANRMIRADPDYAGIPQILADIADDGTVTYRELPNVVQLDLITRALNDVAEGAQGKGVMGGVTNEGRIYGNLSKRIRDNLKEAVPEYRSALSAAGTEIGKLKARELGTELLSSKVWMDEAEEALRDLPDAELAKVREGMRLYIDEMMARTKTVLSDPNLDAREAAAGLKLISSRSAQRKMALVLGEEVADRLQLRLEQAASGVELRASLAANSQTFAREEAKKAVKALNSAGPLESTLRGEPVEGAKRLVQIATDRTPDKIYGREAAEWRGIVDTMTETRGDAGVEQVVRAIEDLQRRQPIDAELATNLGRGAGAAVAIPGYLRATQERNRPR